MPLYTRTGDDGDTGLLGGTRISKDAARVVAYGAVDELNALLGWCAIPLGLDLQQRLQQVQRELFTIGAELASDPNKQVKLQILLPDDRLAQLEEWIDDADRQVPPLAHFILPGGTEGGARLHVARVTCRRAERAVVHLARTESLRAVLLCYLNRLSDLLFAWARLVNHQGETPEIPWRGTDSSA